MNSLLSQDPVNPERHPQESSRAYRAFCLYRDLGPDRSLDRAWASFRAAQSKDRGSSRHPGYWGKWCHQFDWVARADAYDDSIEQQRIAAAAEQRRKLEEDHFQFRIHLIQQNQKLIRILDAALEKNAVTPSMEVTRVQSDEATGTVVTSKYRPPNLTGMAALLNARNGLLTQATAGIPDAQTDRKQIDRVVWIKDAPSAKHGPPASGQSNSQPTIELDADPNDLEEDDEAA
jgi:hypothetical protein